MSTGLYMEALAGPVGPRSPKTAEPKWSSGGDHYETLDEVKGALRGVVGAKGIPNPLWEVEEFDLTVKGAWPAGALKL